MYPLLLVTTFALISSIGGMPARRKSHHTTPHGEHSHPGRHGPSAEDSHDEPRKNLTCYPGRRDFVDDTIPPEAYQRIGDDPTSAYDRGDYVLTRKTLKTLPGRQRGDMTPLNDLGTYWTYNIYYTIEANSSADDSIITEIKTAMNIWAYDTCIRFVELHDHDIKERYHSDYVAITLARTGCYSDTIGRKRGRHIVNIDPEQCGSDLDAITRVFGQVIGLQNKDTSFDIRASYREFYTFTRDNYTYTVWKHLPGEQIYNPRSQNYSVMLREKVVLPVNQQHLLQQVTPVLNCRGQLVKRRLSESDIAEVDRQYSCGPKPLVVTAVGFKDRAPLSYLQYDMLYVRAIAKAGEETIIMRVDAIVNADTSEQGRLIKFEDSTMTFGVKNWDELKIEVKIDSGNEDKDEVIISDYLPLRKGSTYYEFCNSFDCGHTDAMWVGVTLGTMTDFCIYNACE